MTRLLIARHGNTFGQNEIPVRIGRRTDIPLVESGRRQAGLLGKFLKENPPPLSAVYSSCLKRAFETAVLALEAAEWALDVQQMSVFDEIDYGPDEGKAEEEIILRIGKKALEAWDKDAIVPSDWQVNPNEIIQRWHEFAEMVCEQYIGQTVMVVTSNGIARFAPYLTGDIETFKQQYAIKISTGAICSLVKNDPDWKVEYWNIKPKEKL